MDGYKNATIFTRGDAVDISRFGRNGPDAVQCDAVGAMRAKPNENGEYPTSWCRQDESECRRRRCWEDPAGTEKYSTSLVLAMADYQRTRARSAQRRPRKPTFWFSRWEANLGWRWVSSLCLGEKSALYIRSRWNRGGIAVSQCNGDFFRRRTRALRNIRGAIWNCGFLASRIRRRQSRVPGDVQCGDSHGTMHASLQILSYWFDKELKRNSFNMFWRWNWMYEIFTISLYFFCFLMIISKIIRKFDVAR